METNFMEIQNQLYLKFSIPHRRIYSLYKLAHILRYTNHICYQRQEIARVSVYSLFCRIRRDIKIRSQTRDLREPDNFCVSN